MLDALDEGGDIDALGLQVIQSDAVGPGVHAFLAHEGPDLLTQQVIGDPGQHLPVVADEPTLQRGQQDCAEGDPLAGEAETDPLAEAMRVKEVAQ